MFAIACTDLGWFASLRDEIPSRVVNFRTPTPWGVKELQEGDRWYFMLKAPIRRIGGYGSFVRDQEMTATEAWSTYGRGNGMDSELEFVRKMEAFAEKRSAKKRSSKYMRTKDPLIGCIELADIVTLNKEDFIDPADCGHSFPNGVVMFKRFYEEDGIAKRLGR